MKSEIYTGTQASGLVGETPAFPGFRNRTPIFPNSRTLSPSKCQPLQTLATGYTTGAQNRGQLSRRKLLNRKRGRAQSRSIVRGGMVTPMQHYEFISCYA